MIIILLYFIMCTWGQLGITRLSLAAAGDVAGPGRYEKGGGCLSSLRVESELKYSTQAIKVVSILIMWHPSSGL